MILRVYCTVCGRIDMHVSDKLQYPSLASIICPYCKTQQVAHRFGNELDLLWEDLQVVKNVKTKRNMGLKREARGDKRDTNEREGLSPFEFE